MTNEDYLRDRARERERSAELWDQQHEPDSSGRRIRYCRDNRLRLSGVRIVSAIPVFTCGAGNPRDGHVVQLPFAPLSGRHCGSQTGWARVRVTTPSRVRFVLSSRITQLELFSPEGERVLELNDEKRCVEIDMERGLWVFAARPTSEEAGEYNFELWGELMHPLGPPMIF